MTDNEPKWDYTTKEGNFAAGAAVVGGNLLVLIIYILYTIRNNILPALLTASAIAGIFYFNKSKVTNFLKKYNLDKISSVGKWINL